MEKFLSIKEKQVLVNADNRQEILTQGRKFFNPGLSKAKIAYPFLKAVITGNLGANHGEENPDSLIRLVRNNPDMLFTKGDVSFPDGCDLYILPVLPVDIMGYKGHYIWVNNNHLIYVHYDGTKEVIHLDQVNIFKNQILFLPKNELHNDKVIKLSNEQIKAIITNDSGHKPIPHQYFYNVSAFQLMQFFCDENMITHIMRLISPLPEELGDLMKEQLEELGIGGADIIKVGRNPQDPQFKFEDLLHYKTSYIVEDHLNDTEIKYDVTISLLENPNGLIYYKDAGGSVQFYQACIATKTIESVEVIPIEIAALLPEEKRVFDKMMENLDTMEPMSARRSSNDEHKVIAKTMYHSKSIQLHREGITFDLEGIRFRSNHYDFNRRINAYRKYERIFSNHSSRVVKQWCQEVGHIQKEVMWLLQRTCENRPYCPLPDFKFPPFQRAFNIHNLMEGRGEAIYTTTKGFAVGFGSFFAIHKSLGGAVAVERVEGWACARAALVAGISLINDAKANVVVKDYSLAKNYFKPIL